MVCSIRRIVLFVVFFVLLAPFAQAQVHLQHSRLASFSLFCFEFCFPGDDLTIQVKVTADQTTAPGVYQIQLASGEGNLFTVNPDHTLSTFDDPSNPFIKTFFYGAFGDGDRSVTITSSNLGDPRFPYHYPLTITNDLVYDFLWTFLQIPATFTLHPEIHYVTPISLNLTGSPDPDQVCDCPMNKNMGLPGLNSGMVGYSLDHLQVGIVLTDTPVSYSPPHGQSIGMTLTYNQRDTNQPSGFPSSNVGPQWTFNWLSYISAGPVTGQTEAVRYLPGGGQERYIGYTQGTSDPSVFNGEILTFQPHPTTRAVLQALTDTTNGDTRPNFYQLTFPDGTVETYNNNAGGGIILYLTKRVDPQGNTTTINYAPGTAQITSITDAIGQQTTFTYGLVSDGLKITKVTDPFGRSASFTYDPAGRLTSITDAQGLVSAFTYSGASNVINALTTPYGTTSFSSQDGSGSRIVQATDPLGQTERIEYQASLPSLPAQETTVPAATGLSLNNQNLNFFNGFYWDKKAFADATASGALPGSSAFYAFARETHWALDLRGVSATASSEKAALESRVWYNFQGQANPDFVDPSGTTLPSATARVLDDGTTQLYQKTYNANGFVTQSIDPVGRQTNYIYDPNNGIDLLQTTQRNGANNEQLFAATYNALHLPLTSTDAAGQTTTTTYNGFGEPLTITNPKTEITTMAYDPNRFLLSVTGAIPGSTTTFTYDPVGRVKTTTDSEGYTVTNAYDNLNRLVQQTFPDGTTRTTLYDRLTVGSTTDRLGRTTSYVNDALGRMIQTTDPLGRIIHQTWCACGSLQTLTDGNGNVTTWNYDPQGRVTSKVYADGKGDTFVYENSTSRLKSKTDALLQTISYGYARDNNLISITYTNAKNLTPNVTFAYDAAFNRRTTMTDGTGVTAYAYNPVNGQLGAGKLQGVTGPLPNSTLSYTYDQLGRIINRSINGAANQSTFAYDPLGRVTSEINDLGIFTTAYVNQTARPLSLTYPNGQSTLYQYFDNLGDQRLKQIANFGAGAAVLSQFDYSYDAEGQILSWGQQTSGANSFALGYDLAGQLTSANLTGATPKTFAYGYDPAGSRTNETINAAPAPVTVNNLNELVARTGGTPAAFAYDANGNLLSETTNVAAPAPPAGGEDPTERQRGKGNSGGNGNQGNGGHDRDDKNENAPPPPVTIASTETFEWDAENRLTAINQSATNARSEFTYDGLGRRVKIVEKTGTTITATRQFILDGLTTAEEFDSTGVLAKQFFTQGQINGAVPVFYTRDYLGSVREVADSTGTIQSRFDYDPYGRRTLISGSDIADFGFTGHFFHTLSSLHLAPYRNYDAGEGRWLSRDILPNSERSQGTNIYSYVKNQPLSATDPDGQAYFAVRNLNSFSAQPSLTGIREMDERNDIQFLHEQLFFEDSKGGNLGYGIEGLFSETDQNVIAAYKITKTGYNDCIMRKAVAIVNSSAWQPMFSPTDAAYCVVGHNCQSWAKAVRTVYARLASDPGVQLECHLCSF
jgi:RHS repeat-associated protein